MKYEVVSYDHSWSEDEDLYFYSRQDAEFQAQQLNFEHGTDRGWSDGTYWVEEIPNHWQSIGCGLYEDEDGFVSNWLYEPPPKPKCTCGAATLGYALDNLKAHHDWCDVHGKKKV